MTTVSGYLNGIPASAPEYPLAQSILSKITVASGATAHSRAAQQELPGLLNELVQSLIDRKRLSPATILALAACAAPTGGYSVSDAGILGGVNVSGGIVSILSGAY